MKTTSSQILTPIIIAIFISALIIWSVDNDLKQKAFEKKLDDNADAYFQNIDSLKNDSTNKLQKKASPN